MGPVLRQTARITNAGRNHSSKVRRRCCNYSGGRECGANRTDGKPCAAESGWLDGRAWSKGGTLIIRTKKQAYRSPALNVCMQDIEIQRSLRYLGIILDTRLSFGCHMGEVATNATKMEVVLGRMMPNLGELFQDKRALISLMVSSKLLYTASVWAERGVKAASNWVQSTVRIRIERCYRCRLKFQGFSQALHQ